MSALFDWGALPLDALAAEFARGAPFRHVVIDGVLSEEALAEVAADFAREPHYELEDEIYVQLRSQEPPQRPWVRALYDALTSRDAQAAAGRISGRTLVHADGAAYVYGPGHYLLPHSDSRFGRSVAYAFYVKACERGGELALFDCAERDGRIVETKEAKRIAPIANRLVLFEVTPLALHEVREIEEGTRESLAGWFFGGST